MKDQILQKILESKQHEVAVKKKQHNTKRMLQVLSQSHMTVIAEVKRKSPSVGVIAPIPDPVSQARRYSEGGAAAISVLTDGPFFGGSMEDLAAVVLAEKNTPVLMKDFVVDPIQIMEGAIKGASAVLLIVAVLGKRTAEMLMEVRRCGLEALVEVHNAEELVIAIDAGAEMVGVNNRNLKTFDIDLNVAEKLSDKIPSHILAVAESGIRTLDDVKRMAQCGYRAVLVGESLVRALDPAQLIRDFSISCRERK